MLPSHGEKFRWLISSMTLTDRVIVLVAVIFVVGLYVHYWRSNPQPAHYAMVFSPYQAPQRVMLDVPQYLSIQGRLGQSRLEVTPGQIRFVTSPCQGKQCVHAGWLRAGGELASCLPNQVSIQLYGDGEFDALAY